ncbi:MAG: PDZ domain-containing protein [Sphingobacteriales bacterium]|nr:MAG: PDZ domain-containing protein [Sphingobacteriales bacterium]
MRAIACSVLALALLTGAESVSAQQKNSANKKATGRITKSETIVIRDQSSDDKTTVEIRDGQVYINGDMVTQLSGNISTINKKIIIDHSGHGVMQHDAAGGDTGRVRKALLGVLAKRDSRDGATVERVAPGSAAEKIGLKEGDIIKAVDGKPIKSAEELIDAIAERNAGEKITIGYERNGQEKASIATLQAPEGNICLPADPRASTDVQRFRFPDNGVFNFDMEEFFSAPPRLGITGEDMSDESGVKVIDVKDGSVADAAGLQRGDIIYKLGGRDVTNVSSLQNAVRSSRTGSPVKLKYERNGKELETSVTFTKSTRKKEL